LYAFAQPFFVFSGTLSTDGTNKNMVLLGYSTPSVQALVVCDA